MQMYSNIQALFSRSYFIDLKIAKTKNLVLKKWGIYNIIIIFGGIMVLILDVMLSLC